MLTDSHAHLYFDQLKTRFDEVLENMVQSQIGTVINVGVDLETSQQALDQALHSQTSVKIFSTIGLHPHDCNPEIFKTDTDIHKAISRLREIRQSNPKLVVAVGECGLDFSADVSQTKQLQFKLFEAQIALANDLNLPLIVHCRDAWTEMLPYLNQFTGVLHCYSGDVEITQQVLSTNLYISFAGNVTYPKNDWLRESLKLIPLDRVLIETDSPFLAPQSKRGQTNEPTNVREVAECVAQVKGISFEEVANQTTENAKRIFRLG